MKDYRLPNEGRAGPPKAPARAQERESGLKFSNKREDMNNMEEAVEFLPTMNRKKLEKTDPKQLMVAGAVLVFCLLASLLVGFLVWHFKYRNAPVQKLYNGHLRLAGSRFIDAYENSNSSEFAILAEKVKKVIKDIYQSNPEVGPFLTQTVITSFSEGSIIAYYWSEFSVPKLQVDALDKAMANIQASNQAAMYKLRNLDLRVDTIVAFSTDADTIKASQDNSCKYALHAKEGQVTSFTTPGFPNSPYPSNARCQWELRADAGSVISLTFTTVDMEPCGSGNDFVTVYDTLSPLEPHAMVKLCGSYSLSYNLTFISSQNVMLVLLITNGEGRYPGFTAKFFQMPKMENCGASFRGISGNFTTPHFPGHYPPRMNCTWNIEVPSDKNVKVRFHNFFLAEPGVPMDSCTKDYVEVNNVKYCGSKKMFVVTSSTNKMSVHFHSDFSFVDNGFFAEYLAYDSGDPCPGKFTCKTGRCIELKKRCDGWIDCSDTSDERDCVCTEKQFRCNNGWCKPKFWLCDGVNDCGDMSDEQQCQCPANNFKCGNGKCILQTLKCDGRDNCGDGSDEGACNTTVTVPCQEYTYKCQNNLCVNKKNPECDGVKDCNDNSDEDNCDCGMQKVSKKSRIVGGANAEEGEWPWQVSMHVRNVGHFCGASLISQKWLVSAAHCFRDANYPRYADPQTWIAFMGLLDQRDRDNPNVQKRAIRRIITHPSFNDFTYDYDIAVLELDSPVTFTKQIQPICLPAKSHEFPAGKVIHVTGWGATEEGAVVGASVLQKAEIRVINQTICESLMPNQLTLRMMCVGILEGGIDACQGDSGGPLTSIEANNKMFLAGVVSWGDGCARRNKPGAYTRVSLFRDWIRQNSGV